MVSNPLNPCLAPVTVRTRHGRVRAPGAIARWAVPVFLLLVVFARSGECGWPIAHERACLSPDLGDIGTAAIASDGAGGMLAAYVATESGFDRVNVTRVDHNGNEMWGDHGRALTASLAQNGQGAPLTLTHDGAGGAYVSYVGHHDGFDMLWLARVSESSDVLWNVPIDDLGLLPASVEFTTRSLPLVEGDVLLIWTQFDASGNARLYAARVDATGSFDWHTPITDWTIDDVQWRLVSDGASDAFVLFRRLVTTAEGRIQLLRTIDGSAAWAAPGVEIPSAFYDAVSDGAGGVYVVGSELGVAYARRIDSTGGSVWPTDVEVHDTQTPWVAYSTAPLVCTDGAGGFVLLHGFENLYAQRVGPNGGLLWGNGVTVVAPVDRTRPRSIVSDGFGGAIMSWSSTYDLDATTACRVADGARYDAFGHRLWHRFVDSCEYGIYPDGSHEIMSAPHHVVPVADGSGGALFGWRVYDGDTDDDVEVWGLGVDARGDAPTPRLTYLSPDAGEPEQAGPYVVFGDYLDLSLRYELVAADGWPGLTLTPSDPLGFRQVAGVGALSGLSPGPYHLVVSEVDVADAAVDTLHHAIGVGFPVACEGTTEFVGDTRSTNLGGSPRQAVYDDEGRLHVLWVEFEPTSSQHQLRLWTFDGAWLGHEHLFTSAAGLRDPTLCRGAEDVLHAFCVESGGSGDALVHVVARTDGSVLDTESYPHHAELNRPVSARTADDRVHVVTEAGLPPASQLLHFVAGDEPLRLAHTVATGFAPGVPDMVAIGQELELVFRRQGPLPGLHQVQRSTYGAGSWSTPAMFGFGLDVASPSVAFDGDERTLYAWIVDNEPIDGIPPLVRTRMRTGSTVGETRVRPGMLVQHEVNVLAAGAGRFLMLTRESEGGPDVSLFLREGDGNVFFPRDVMNTTTDVADPRLAARAGGRQVAVYWRDYDDPSTDVTGRMCEGTATAVGPDVPRPVDQALRARPNPFNAGVEFRFEMERRGTVRLEVFDTSGRHVRTVFAGEVPDGPASIAWDGRDDAGDAVASGVYLGRLSRADGSARVRKVALVR